MARSDRQKCLIYVNFDIASVWQLIHLLHATVDETTFRVAPDTMAAVSPFSDSR